MKKPPLGLLKENLYWEMNERTEEKERERHQDVIDAIKRYMEDFKPVPPEWIKEYHKYIALTISKHNRKGD